MKINIQTNKGFTIADAVVGMALFAISAGALLNGVIFGFHQIQVGRHQEFATQILLDKSEALRVPYVRFDAINVVTRFDATTNESYQVFQPDMTYNIRLYTEPFTPSNPTSYKDQLKVVHLKAFWWETPARLCEVHWVTYVSKNGTLEQFIEGFQNP